MKLLFVLLCLTSVTVSVTAQEFVYKKKIDKWVFKDERKKLDYAFAYDTVQLYHQFYAVSNNNLWSYFNIETRKQSRFQCQAIQELNSDFVVIKLEDKLGVINHEEEYLLPAIYDDIDYYNKSAALVKLNGTWQLLDSMHHVTSGEIVFYRPDTMATIIGPSSMKHNNLPVGPLLEFLYRNIQYPPKARKDEAEGIVVASLIINAKGEMKDVTIVRSIHPDLDTEVIRVFNLMKFQWNSATKDGESVASKINIPVKFKFH